MSLIKNLPVIGLTCWLFALTIQLAHSQEDDVGLGAGITPSHGDVVPRDVREMTDRGLQYLLLSQTEEGSWRDAEPGPGTTGLGLFQPLIESLKNWEDVNDLRLSFYFENTVAQLIPPIPAQYYENLLTAEQLEVLKSCRQVREPRDSFIGSMLPW